MRDVYTLAYRRAADIPVVCERSGLGLAERRARVRGLGLHARQGRPRDRDSVLVLEDRVAAAHVVALGARVEAVLPLGRHTFLERRGGEILVHVNERHRRGEIVEDPQRGP